MKLRITILKYHSWYLCQISLQIMLLPILIRRKRDETCLFLSYPRRRLRFWIQAMDSRFQVLCSGFFFFSGTLIQESIFSGIPDSLSWYFRFYKQNFPGFRNPDSLHKAIFSAPRSPLGRLLTMFIYTKRCFHSWEYNYFSANISKGTEHWIIFYEFCNMIAS